jgi:hypothetical protein
MLCPLCGCEFDQTDHSCLSNCPMAAVQGCNLICCPNCGYQMVDESKSGIARLLRRLTHSSADPDKQEPKP